MHFLNGLNIPINLRLKVNRIFSWDEQENIWIHFLGHAVVEISTRDFFTWLQQAETEVEEGEEEEGH